MKILRNKKILLIACGIILCLCFREKSRAESPLINENALSVLIGEVRTGVFKLVSSGVPIEQVRFNTPQNFELLDTPEIGVFHPDGGAILYKDISPPPPLIGILSEKSVSRWLVSGEIAIPMISQYTTGRSSTDDEQLSEIIAYLPGIRKHVCEKINDGLGIKGIPKLKSDQSALYEKEMIDSGDTDYVLPSGKQPYLDNPEFKGQPFGCFEDFSTDRFVYYHTIFER